MAVAAPEKTKPVSQKPLLPPDEKFWQRYSPRHEFPLAGVTSFFAHCFIVGIVALAAFLLMLRRESEGQKPVRLNSVELAQATEGGEEGKGAAPGSPGDRTEMAETAPKPAEKTENPPPPAKDNFESPKVQLTVPELTPVDTQGDTILSELAKIGQQAKESSKEPVKAAKPPGTNNPDGKGGRGGDGGGPGRGTKGTGLDAKTGTGGILTKQEIFARRWRFDLAGGPKEHAAKLAAVGVTLGFADSRGSFLVVQDLTKRPVHARRDRPEKYFGVVVIWRNDKQDSVQALARELQLSFAPPAVFMMLPKDREEKMAEVEAAYARQQGRSTDLITETWFDFRLQDGSFEPFVIRQH